MLPRKSTLARKTGMKKSARMKECARGKVMSKRRPPIIALENVGGFVSADGGEPYRALQRALGGLGYEAGAMLIGLS
jgi:site-specific DNA-cytosine methylase